MELKDIITYGILIAIIYKIYSMKKETFYDLSIDAGQFGQIEQVKAIVANATDGALTLRGNINIGGNTNIGGRLNIGSGLNVNGYTNITLPLYNYDDKGISIMRGENGNFAFSLGRNNGGDGVGMHLYKADGSWLRKAVHLDSNTNIINGLTFINNQSGQNAQLFINDNTNDNTQAALELTKRMNDSTLSTFYQSVAKDGVYRLWQRGGTNSIQGDRVRMFIEQNGNLTLSGTNVNINATNQIDFTNVNRTLFKGANGASNTHFPYVDPTNSIYNKNYISGPTLFREGTVEFTSSTVDITGDLRVRGNFFFDLFSIRVRSDPILNCLLVYDTASNRIINFIVPMNRQNEIVVKIENWGAWARDYTWKYLNYTWNISQQASLWDMNAEGGRDQIDYTRIGRGWRVRLDIWGSGQYWAGTNDNNFDWDHSKNNVDYVVITPYITRVAPF
jgi:hypothetical protein